MLKILVVKENIERALKQFKRKFRYTQVLKEVRERKHYIKKSLKRKIQKEEAIRKFKKQQEDE